MLWLLGICLRATLLAVAPLLPVVSSALRLDQAEAGALANLPVLLLGLGAAVGSATIGRLGATRAIVAGLFLEAAGGALRGVGTSVVVLFGCTFVMGLGIAMLQPALPALVRRWYPDQIGTATSVYGNGLLIGETIAASLTLSIVLKVTGSWQGSLALWSAPVVVTLLLVRLADRGTGRGAERQTAVSTGSVSTGTISISTGTVSTGTKEPPPMESVPPGLAPPAEPHPPPAPAPVRPRPLSWPLLRGSRVWRLGLVQGGASAAYFATNAYLPGILDSTGHGHLVGAALTVLNVSQLAASALLLGFADHLIRRRWPLWSVAAALACVAGGLLVASPPVLLVLSGLLGFCTAFVLLLSLALPAAESSDEREVAAISAGMFTIGYTIAFALPLAGGTAADATGSLRVTLVPALVGGLLALVASAGFHRLPSSRPHGSSPGFPFKHPGSRPGVRRTR